MTALKTLSLRIRGYSEETEELDPELKNITGDVIDLTKTVQHSQGISLFTDETQEHYRSMVDYLGDISDIWDEIDEKSRTQLLEKLFGKRGASVGSAILGNFEQVRKALEEMEQAGGSADAEMSIIEKSLDYKLNELSQTWVGTFQKMTDRGDIGKLIDILTGLSEAIGSVVEKAGLLGTLAFGGGLFAGIKNIGICMRVCTNQTCFEYALYA
ncbi:MAG: phage tail tape measure protein [Firmicutes bacterium]|nr:phage tail tape measure protein [Candidatus Colivicinus equi]